MARTSRRREAAKLMAKPSVKAGSSLHKLKANEGDRISKLPNDILVNILDRLDFRDVTRTGVLSRRWSHVPANLSRVKISARDFLSPQTSLSDDELHEKLVRINAANAAVVKATKSMLAHRDPGGCTIRLLSTTFYLRGDAPISIGHTVGNAMETHKVEKAEFIVLTEKGHKCSLDNLVNYGTRFVSFFNKCHNAFAGLTRLYLENLRFRESDFVSNILVTCKQLNFLGFCNCNTADWITLQVEHAQLSDLSIVDCRFDMVKLTWVPKLTWLVFLFWISSIEPPLSLGYVPLLEVLSLSNVALNRHNRVKLSSFLHETSVRDLTLGFKCEKIWVQPESLTRRLNLVGIPEGYDLTWTMFFLEAAPSLEELYMMVCDHPCEMEMNQEIGENKGVEWESPTSNFKHHCLAKFILVGFQAKDYMVSHVRRVLKAAVNLQDVYLYDRLVCAKCKKKVGNARKYDAPGVNLPIKFPYTNEDRRSVQKRMPRGIGSLAKIHFLASNKIRSEHAPRIDGYSLGAIEDSWMLLRLGRLI